MKIHKLNLPEFDQQVKAQLVNNVYICQSNEHLKKELDGFKERFEMNSCDGTQGIEFLCILPLQEQDRIVGVIRIEPNNVRTQFHFSPDQEERLYHEYVSLALDEDFFNSTFLLKCFTYTIKHSIEIEKEKHEVFWYSYRKELFSQIIECDVLNKVKEECDYYFVNQAKYFTDHLLKEMEREKVIKEKICSSI